MMENGVTPAMLDAIRICAPYGSSPCVKHDAVSSIDADILLSIPYLLEISAAMEPTVIIATVLLAVHTLTKLTRAAMQYPAPFSAFYTVG